MADTTPGGDGDPFAPSEPPSTSWSLQPPQDEDAAVDISPFAPPTDRDQPERIEYDVLPASDQEGAWSAPPPPTPRRPRPSQVVSPVAPPATAGFWRTGLVALVAGLIGAAAAGGTVYWLTEGDTPAAGPPVTVLERVETQILNPEDSGSTAAAVARRVLPSIVTVEVTGVAGGDFVPDGSGSGVVLDAGGILVTNQHVVDGSQRVRVVFPTGRSYPADVVGEDALTDLAVLEIEAVGLTAIELGSTESMFIGDTAIAIGSPLGLEGGPSVTVGVVSAFDRRVQTGPNSELFGMLQTDAPITRGSSGGALVDDAGRLIGITSAIGVSDVGAEGLGFAIPVELMMRITDELRETGSVRHAFLGITGSTFFEEQTDGATIPAGVLVAEILPATAAEVSGLEIGDIILSFDDDPVTTMEQLVVSLRFFAVDDEIEVRVLRDGSEVLVPITLLERPEGV